MSEPGTGCGRCTAGAGKDLTCGGHRYPARGRVHSSAAGSSTHRLLTMMTRYRPGSVTRAELANGRRRRDSAARAVGSFQRRAPGERAEQSCYVQRPVAANGVAGTAVAGSGFGGVAAVGSPRCGRSVCGRGVFVRAGRSDRGSNGRRVKRKGCASGSDIPGLHGQHADG